MNLFDVYPLFDVNIVKGKGCSVWDDKGQEYLDLYGGHAVISIGHCHPHYVEKVTKQLNTLGFYSNSVVNTLQLAVEATDNPKIIAPVNANGHVTYLPLNDLAAWEAELSKGDVCACMIECIQGVGGIKLVDEDFARGLSAACKRHGAVLVCDEIQCGYGRSGKFFAHQWLGIRPDLITVAKGIANGFPMGAVLISPDFKPEYGQLGTTFGGNHLGCAAALAVLDVMEGEHLVDNARETGGYLTDRLLELKATEPRITDVRGRGLMIGIDLAIPHKELRGRLVYQEHCFTGCASTNILRLLPPLTFTKAMADDFILRLKRAFAAV